MSEKKLKPCPFHNCLTCGCYDTLYMRDKDWNTRPIEDALTARIAELEAAQRWIPVSERLPEAYTRVLVVCAGGYMTVQPMILPNVDNKPYFPVANVTHWMPLPPPPEGGKMSEAFFIMTCHERHRLYRINAANDGDFVGFIWFDEDCNAWVFELVNSNFHFTAPALQEILEFMRGLEW